jgi:dihydroorotate dehydrogenase (fumarate)
MSDLSTTYLGLTLKNPLVVSPSPLCTDLAAIRRMEDAGAAAVVLHSLFEEQLTLEGRELDRFLTSGTESFAEALSYFPDLQAYKLGPEGYLEHIRKAKAAVKIPIIGSLNGISTGGWISYAKKIEQAGADALELNVYYIAADPDMSGAQVEQMYADLVRDVRASLKIPVAVKLGPYFSSMASMARRLDQAGANGLVLFNRFYQPDFDLEKLEVVPNLNLSRSEELRLRLCWVAILYGRIKADMAITGGVHTAEDVIKSMMSGARVAMMTSALLKNGIEHLKTVLEGIGAWMEKYEYISIRQMQGSMSQKSVAEPAAFVRANYMKVLTSYVLR